MFNRHGDPTQRLLNDLRAMPEGLQGPHLLTDLFLGYASNTLPDETREEVDVHLASCRECAARMEHFLEMKQAWEGREGAARLASLQERILAKGGKTGEIGIDLARLARWFGQAIDLSLAGRVSLRLSGATTSAEGERGSDENGQWLTWEDAEGNLHISLELNEPALEGMAVRFQAGSWQQDVILRRTADAPDSLSASVMVPAADRRNLPEDASLTYVIIPAMS